MKVYPCPVVGESQYQPAIARTHEGEVATICIETGNPFDELALRVENNLGEVIGYIPRTSWLRRAIHDDGRGVAATIMSIGEGGEGIMGVVLSVTLTDDLVPERQYVERKRIREPDHAVTQDQHELVRRMIEIVVRSSNFPITCTCGRGAKISFAGLTATTKIHCKACGEDHRLDQREIDRLDGEMFDVIGQLFAQSDMPVPPRGRVIAIRLSMTSEDQGAASRIDGDKFGAY